MEGPLPVADGSQTIGIKKFSKKISNETPDGEDFWRTGTPQLETTSPLRKCFEKS